MNEPKIKQFQAGLAMIASRVQKVEFTHPSGLAMFYLSPPLTDEEQRALEQLDWAAGANRAGFGDGGSWQ